MKQVTVLAALSIVIGMTACKSKSAESQQVTPGDTVLPTNTTPVNPQVNQPSNSNQVNTTPTTTTTTVKPNDPMGTVADANISPASKTGPQTLAPATSTSTTAPGMNPAHGQPGHRCDIAVGAPLNSKPNQQPTITTTPTTTTTAPQIQMTPTTTTAPTTTAPGMNPAHGQPGHRCDIAVGAPLNSKPQPTVSTVPVTTSPTQGSKPKQ